MQIVGEDAVTAAVRQALATHQGERDKRLDKITRALEADGRVTAAWVFGSLGRSGGDALSDLDLFVIVEDATFDEVAGSAAARECFVAAAGGPPIVIGEAPQNAPPGGAYVGVLYAGAVGPHRADWYWQRRSGAVMPRDGVRVLFDRVGLPRCDAAPMWDFQPMPEETREEKAARDCGAFWSMLLIAAKYVARSPNEDGMGLLRWAFVPLNALERLVGVSVTPEVGVSPSGKEGAGEFTDPGVKVYLLRCLTGRMASLTPMLAARGIALPDVDTAAQADRYLDLVEAIASKRARKL